MTDQTQIRTKDGNRKVYEDYVWSEGGHLVVATETGEFHLTIDESRDLFESLLNGIGGR
jgi:dihydrodipicolinate synthase/N-acetylneuraminate lyase